METRWMYKTSYNFAALREESQNVCVIPMGCIEKHGLHMPVGCDIITASSIAALRGFTKSSARGRAQIAHTTNV